MNIQVVNDCSGDVDGSGGGGGGCMVNACILKTILSGSSMPNVNISTWYLSDTRRQTTRQNQTEADRGRHKILVIRHKSWQIFLLFSVNVIICSWLCILPTIQNTEIAAKSWHTDKYTTGHAPSPHRQNTQWWSDTHYNTWTGTWFPNIFTSEYTKPLSMCECAIQRLIKIICRVVYEANYFDVATIFAKYLQWQRC